MLQPFVSGSGGFLYFYQRTCRFQEPLRFNFTYDFGGGIQIVKDSGRGITVGYKYNHISNGYHASINPACGRSDGLCKGLLDLALVSKLWSLIGAYFFRRNRPSE